MKNLQHERPEEIPWVRFLTCAFFFYAYLNGFWSQTLPHTLHTCKAANSVGSLMTQTAMSLCKFFLTGATLVWSFASMYSFVNREVMFSGERLLANLATEWFLTRVSPHVNP